MAAFAQEEHMTFMGIPMNGPVNSFVQKLQKKGMTHFDKREGTIGLKGRFATYNDCTIIVYENKGNVSSVAVMFPEQNSWNSVTNRYYSLQSMLVEKYGTPKTIEYFSNGDPGYDYLRINALQHDECFFASEYYTSKGNIILSMVKGMDYNTASVCIIYRDGMNTEDSRKAMMDDL